jgi:hypothetical protein
MAEDTVLEGEVVEEEDLPVSRPASQEVALVTRSDITVAELVQQSNVIEDAMRNAMRDGVHYGTIPGVSKPTLLKPGAEKLLVLFRLAPSYESEKIWHEDGHLTVMTNCTLTHIQSGLVIAEGEGLCTTKESRYAWRQGGRVCPVCAQPAIIKGKAEYGGGWICFAKKGGCGTKWADGTDQAKEFEGASLDRIANPDLPDSYNTVLKMADKRALLAAILNGTAASDVFTQDMEDAGSTGGGPYSSGEEGERQAQAPAEPPKFDPARNLRKDAPTLKQGWKAVNATLLEVEPSIEWGKVIEQAVKGLFGDDFVIKEGTPEQKAEAFNRTSNAVGRLTELFSEETFLSLETVQKAFAEMFEGVIVTVAEFENDEPAPIQGHTGTSHPDE